MKIPKDTKYFHYFNENPKNRKTGDCVIRALTSALQLPYWDILDGLVDTTKKYGYEVTTVENFDRYLKVYRFLKQKQLRKSDNTKYTGKEFADYLTDNLYIMNGYPVIANIGGHHTTVFVADEDGVVKCQDIWDPTDFTVGNYWVKSK